MNNYFKSGNFNRGYFLRQVVCIDDFKFMLKSKYKSRISLKIKTSKDNVFTAIAYDEKADYILRNDF